MSEGAECGVGGVLRGPESALPGLVRPPRRVRRQVRLRTLDELLELWGGPRSNTFCLQPHIASHDITLYHTSHRSAPLGSLARSTPHAENMH